MLNIVGYAAFVVLGGHLRALFETLSRWVTPVLLRNVVNLSPDDLLVRILEGHLSELADFLRRW